MDAIYIIKFSLNIYVIYIYIASWKAVELDPNGWILQIEKNIYSPRSGATK